MWKERFAEGVRGMVEGLFAEVVECGFGEASDPGDVGFGHHEPAQDGPAERWSSESFSRELWVDGEPTAQALSSLATILLVDVNRWINQSGVKAKMMWRVAPKWGGALWDGDRRREQFVMRIYAQ